MADVKFAVSVSSEGAVKSIETLDQAFEKLGKQSTTTGKATASFGQEFMGKLIPAFTAATLAADGIRKALGFLKGQITDTLKASMEAESVDRALEASLGAIGETSEHVADSIKNYASELQRKTVYDDEAIKSAQTLIIQMRGTARGIDDATKAAVGLASAYKMDLQSAARAVAQGLEGNYRALNLIIPAVRSATTESEKHAAMLEGFARAYQRAESETTTFEGALKQLKNVYNDLQESIGNFVTQNKEVLDSLTSVKYIIEWINANAQKFNISLTSLMPQQMQIGLKLLKLLGAEAKQSLEESGRAAWQFDDAQKRLLDTIRKSRDGYGETGGKLHDMTSQVFESIDAFKGLKDVLGDIEEIDPASIFPDPTEFVMPPFLDALFVDSKARMEAMSTVWRVETDKQGDYSDELYSDIRRGFTATFNAFKLTAEGFKNFFIDMWKAIKNAFFSILADMLAKWLAMAFVRFLLGAVTGGLSATAEGIATAGGVLTGAPAFAKGFQGVTSKPTPIIVGEAGPEYVSVVPMNQPSSAMAPAASFGGGMTPAFAGAGFGASVTLNFNAPLITNTGDLSDPVLMGARDRLVDAVNKGLRDIGHRTI